MNLLVLSTWFPYPADNGSRLRAFHLLRQLGRIHRIRLVTGVQSDSPGDVAALQRELPGCVEIETVPWDWYDGGRATGRMGALRALFSTMPRSVRETYDPAIAAAVARQATKPTDLILVLQQGMDPYVPASDCPKILEEIEVSGMEQAARASFGLARLRRMVTHQKNVNFWRRRLRRYDAVTAVSESEAAAVRAVIGAATPPVEVVPNGVDISAYASSDRSAGVPGRLIYNGALNYPPNREAVLWFVREMLPVIARSAPEAHLVVTGRYDAALVEVREIAANPRVQLTGFVEDMNTVLSTGVLCVAPLRSGGGTRLKILEAWAARLPVVATTVGAAGLGATEGREILRADTPDKFAADVVRLLQDAGKRADIATAAFEYARAHYDWFSIAAALNRLMEAVTKDRLVGVKRYGEGLTL